MDNIKGTGFLRLSQIIPGIIPVARSTWWKWCAAGKAPSPIKLGPRITAWRAEDIRAFVAKPKYQDSDLKGKASHATLYNERVAP